ncbi:MAG: hypothetical protein HC911_16940, partial [Chloroflexaceae bacterium]|nr:hypothetical protein [Chloroflexaceae bacterium]
DPSNSSGQGGGVGSGEGDTVFRPFDPSGEQGEREFVQGRLVRKVAPSGAKAKAHCPA